MTIQQINALQRKTLKRIIVKHKPPKTPLVLSPRKTQSDIDAISWTMESKVVANRRKYKGNKYKQHCNHL